MVFDAPPRPMALELESNCYDLFNTISTRGQGSVHAVHQGISSGSGVQESARSTFADSGASKLNVGHVEAIAHQECDLLRAAKGAMAGAVLTRTGAVPTRNADTSTRSKQVSERQEGASGYSLGYFCNADA